MELSGECVICLYKFEIFEENVWKAIHNFEHKNRPDTLHYFTTDFFFYRGHF